MYMYRYVKGGTVGLYLELCHQIECELFMVVVSIGPSVNAVSVS